MTLSTELISQFAKIVTPKETRPEFTTVTGRAKLYDGKMYVQIDGSNGQLTPIASSTVGLKDNDWVTVQIKNHSATVTGNATDPSAGKSYADDIKGQVDDVSDQISEFEIIIADKVDVGDLNAVNGRIDNLVSENVTITGKLDAVEADIGELTADNVTIKESLTAQSAQIENLEATKLSADIADLKYATIENLDATNANIHNLEADYGDFKKLTADDFSAINADIDNLEATKLSAEQADLKYANIDFANIGIAAVEELFAKSGIIGDLVVSDQHITGHLVGVTISGDLIEGNTIKADKLVVLGDDGLYYKLNVNAETVAAEQTEYNSLNGTIITAKSITAEKVAVDDLVAFGATIGGYHITDSSLYSGVKSSATNTTRGVFMNDDGEFSVGDNANYLRFFKDTDGTYKLEISARSIKIGANSTPLEDAVTSTVEEFYLSDSPVMLEGGEWSEKQPTWTQGKFIWRRTRVEYLSGVIDYTPSSTGVCITGNTGADGQNGSPGEKGEKGDPGEPGADGADGRGIVSTEIRYQASSSQTEPPDGEWLEDIPELGSDTPYLWTRTLITYTDDTTSVSYSVSSTTEGTTISATASGQRVTIGENAGFQPIEVRIYGNGTVDTVNLVVADSDDESQQTTVEIPLVDDEGITYQLQSLNGEIRDELTIDSSGTVSLIKRVGDGAALEEPENITLGQVTLSNLIPSGCTVWADATNTLDIDVQYWTVAGEPIGEVSNTANSAANTAADASSAATDAQTSADEANAAIEVLNNMISNLVTSEDGTSLMTQTENGWVFNIGTVLSDVETVSDTLNEALSALDDVQTIQQNLQTVTDDLIAKTAYISMGTDSLGNPQLMLGRTDSDFKVTISNEAINFLQGTERIAYITNRKLYIQASTVTDELQIGNIPGYIWKRRGNNHLGLRYVTS